MIADALDKRRDTAQRSGGKSSAVAASPCAHAEGPETQAALSLWLQAWNEVFFHHKNCVPITESSAA